MQSKLVPCILRSPLELALYNILGFRAVVVVVSSGLHTLTFYSDNPCSNPAEVYNFIQWILFEKDVNKRKKAGNGPFLFYIK